MKVPDRIVVAPALTIDGRPTWDANGIRLGDWDFDGNSVQFAEHAVPYLHETPAREHADELAQALREVKHDCELRAVKGVVPIGRSAWIALTEALAKLENADG